MPTTIPGRIELVGTALYGKAWRARLAAALGISRSTMFQWCLVNGRRRDDAEIDSALIDLLDAQRDAATEKSLELADLRHRFIMTANRRSPARA
jgi:hypothetical protein